MSDPDPAIHAQVTRLVSREHELREHLEGAGRDASHDHRQELRSIEEALDVCWDLLRQRQARRGAGQDPADAQARPAGEVEGYLQ